MGLPLSVLAFGEAGFGRWCVFTISNLLHFRRHGSSTAPLIAAFPLGTVPTAEQGADGSSPVEGAVEREGMG